MESDDGKTAVTVNPIGLWLEREAKEFSFVQAVRLIEMLSPGSVRLGQASSMEHEALRFGAHASLAFPCTDIELIKLDEENAEPCYKMTVNFFGLFGPASPLPPMYTMEVIQEDGENIRNFLDFFNHRLLSLFYRSCTKYRHYLRERDGLKDYEEILFAMMGLRNEEMRPEQYGLQWKKLLPVAGLLSMRSRSPSVIGSVISYYFNGIPVQIQEYIARWVKIPEKRLAKLASPACRLIKTPDLNQMDAAILGERVVDVSGKFRVVLGSLVFSSYMSFLPDGERYRELFQLIRFLVRDQFDFDVELQTAEVPPMQLGLETCRLAYSTWLAPSSSSGSIILASN